MTRSRTPPGCRGHQALHPRPPPGMATAARAWHPTQQCARVACSLKRDGVLGRWVLLQAQAFAQQQAHDRKVHVWYVRVEREEHRESVEATSFAKGRLEADECRVVVAQVEQGGNHPQGE
eukprot:scaffold92283_cov75-Phaeocystis_antarctica.AAC.4